MRKGLWVEDAACTTVPVEVFYGTDDSPLNHREKSQAKSICVACPVRFECLAHALETKEYWGIWGGLDERERRALLKEHKTVKAVVTFIKTTKAAS